MVVPDVVVLRYFLADEQMRIQVKIDSEINDNPDKMSQACAVVWIPGFITLRGRIVSMRRHMIMGIMIGCIRYLHRLFVEIIEMCMIVTAKTKARQKELGYNDEGNDAFERLQQMVLPPYSTAFPSVYGPISNKNNIIKII